ncbi:MAG: ABC transporter substrate-binding protein [Croceibacterium sp.]
MRCLGLGLAAGLALACSGTARAQDSPGPLAIYGNQQTFEIAPVLVAAQDYPGGATVRMGGIPNLVGEPGAAGFSEVGAADLATNAETQLLRLSVAHPDLRIILGVSEGLYRIVARRSAGIATVADLKGKRIATIEPTSSGYFLQSMLARAGLSFADIIARPIVPLSGMTEALAKGEVDAVVIWEPESENAAQVLGEDLVVFGGEGVYRELFNLNTTAGKLADPQVRPRIVRFVRAVLEASAQVRRDPARAQALVAQAGGFSAAEIAESWPHHRFDAGFPPDLLDVLVAEEQWLAAQAKRPARPRDELATLIDTSVYEEALALGDDR